MTRDSYDVFTGLDQVGDPYPPCPPEPTEVCRWCGEEGNGTTYKLDRQDDGGWCCRWESCEAAQRRHDAES